MDKLYRIIAKAVQRSSCADSWRERHWQRNGGACNTLLRTVSRKAVHSCVDCGSLVPTLIESKLCGYVKGAFTGAMQSKEGLLAIAEGGTGRHSRKMKTQPGPAPSMFE